MIDASELIFIGIDVSKDGLELALSDKGKTHGIDNDEAGIAQLLATVKAAGGKVGAVVLEAMGGFERPVAVALCRMGLPVKGVGKPSPRPFCGIIRHRKYPKW